MYRSLTGMIFEWYRKSYAGALDYGAFDITLELTIGEGPCSSFLLAMRKKYHLCLLHLSSFFSSAAVRMYKSDHRESTIYLQICFKRNYLHPQPLKLILERQWSFRKSLLQISSDELRWLNKSCRWQGYYIYETVKA